MNIIGIDVGGTFTDLYNITSSGKEILWKSSTTPENPMIGVMNAIREAKIDLSEVTDIVHGTTIATNAIIERKYPITAMVTTKGFRDLIEIGRYHRKELYNAYQTKPVPLIKRRYRFEIPERIDANGNIVERLDELTARKIAQEIVDAGIRNIAICFINSYMNSVHEVLMENIFKEIDPDLNISISSKVLPKIRPLGRFITTILNVTLKLIISDYASKLDNELRLAGFKGNLWFVQSNGGIIRVDEVVEHSEMLLLSGPAGGVAGASFTFKKVGIPNVITMDIGGTSCDISMIENYSPVVTTDRMIEWDMPVPVPMVDITTIGAGGGSIAWVDSQGILKVGPQSAGADPGPAFYGKSEQATLADANLALGYLNPENFIGGRIPIDPSASQKALSLIGQKVGISNIVKVAQGIVNIANNNMANAIAEVLIKKGRDPRDFVLVAFGGSGPLHAVAIAKNLSIPTVVVPVRSSVFSAYGATLLNAQHEFYETYYSEVQSADKRILEDMFDSMADQGRKLLARQGFQEIEIRRYFEMRYVGQSYELEVEIPDGPLDLNKIENKFIKEHEKIYSVSILDNKVALLNLRVSAIGKRITPTAAQDADISQINSQLVKGKRSIYLIGTDDPVLANIIDGPAMKQNDVIEGPAIIEFDTTTILVEPSMTAERDKYDNILIKIGGGM